MEDNSMENNDRLMDALTKRLQEIQLSAPKTSNDNKTPHLPTFGCIIFLLVTILFICSVMLCEQTKNDSLLKISMVLGFSLLTIVGCIGIIYLIYKQYYLEQAELEREKEKIIKEREEFLIQAMIDLEYQKQLRPKNQKMTVQGKK